MPRRSAVQKGLVGLGGVGWGCVGLVGMGEVGWGWVGLDGHG
jgi:hypothetical protein